MANRITLNVSLTPELEQFIHARVDSGRYLSASEVIREGLRLLEDAEQQRESALQELRELIGAALEEAKRGELLDGEQVMANLLRRHQERVMDAATESAA